MTTPPGRTETQGPARQRDAIHRRRSGADRLAWGVTDGPHRLDPPEPVVDVADITPECG